jgi:hypothetical protein
MGLVPAAQWFDGVAAVKVNGEREREEEHTKENEPR